MKKIILATSILVGLGLTANARGLSVHAEEVDSKNSEVQIGFKEDEQINRLRLVYIPPMFDFGLENETSASSIGYPNLIEDPQYVVVSDNRVLTSLSGWTVSAQLSKITDKGNQQGVELEGARLKLVALPADMKEYTGTAWTATGDQPKADELQDFSAGMGPVSGTTTTGVVLDAAGASEEILANEIPTRGGWAAEITDATLTVPSSDGYGGYQFEGTITWTLDNTL